VLHEPFIHRCLALAARGRGLAGNGAMVGAVLVRNGSMIAEGYHKGFGLAHAERDLLERFKGHIEPTDILYVNLEPCCHHGKTPPCTQIVIDRGVKTVVYGMTDPDTRVAGKGRALLEEQKINVIGPVLRAQCEWFNRGYLTVRTKKRPWITLKSARTLDGRIANPDGSHLAITSPEQNQWSHTVLRALSDAIIVGSGTIERDNPKLMIRYSNSALKSDEKSDHKNYFHRIVLDAQFCTAEDATVLIDDHRAMTIVVTAEDNILSEKAKRLEANDVRVFGVETDVFGMFRWEPLWKALLAPRDGFFGLTSVLVEGGPKTWKAFREAGMVDEEITLLGQ
jgi:diaminohydroxyphosphoribosylaminopyrimidine deaminase / 5-amino-6-(5-phosphoribosylamino)uracil reductase